VSSHHHLLTEAERHTPVFELLFMVPGALEAAGAFERFAQPVAAVVNWPDGEPVKHRAHSRR